MRPILILKKLNAAPLNTPYFRMETVKDVCHALRPGDWAASIDPRDSYFHVLLHHSTKKYMCFGWRGCLYRFCLLPFSLSPAPKVFTALTRFIKVHFRSGHRGQGGPQPSSPCLRALGEGDPLLFVICFSAPFFACRPHRAKISASVSSSFLVGIEAAFSTGLFSSARAFRWPVPRLGLLA
jgi:hypothetical protein